MAVWKGVAMPVGKVFINTFLLYVITRFSRVLTPNRKAAERLFFVFLILLGFRSFGHYRGNYLFISKNLTFQESCHMSMGMEIKGFKKF